MDSKVYSFLPSPGKGPSDKSRSSINRLGQAFRLARAATDRGLKLGPQRREDLGRERIIARLLRPLQILESRPPRRGQSRSIKIERPGRRPLVGVFLGPAHRLAELLFEQAVAVLQGGDLALEDV